MTHPLKIILANSAGTLNVQTARDGAHAIEVLIGMLRETHELRSGDRISVLTHPAYDAYSGS